MPSKSLGNAVIRAFPGLFRILRMCAPRRAAAVVRPRGREKSADRRRRILISRLLIIRASVPRRKSPFPAYFKGFPAVSLLIPPYPAFLKYPVSPQHPCKMFPPSCTHFRCTTLHLNFTVVLTDIHSLQPTLTGFLSRSVGCIKPCGHGRKRLFNYLANRNQFPLHRPTRRGAAYLPDSAW